MSKRGASGGRDGRATNAQRKVAQAKVLKAKTMKGTTVPDAGQAWADDAHASLTQRPPARDGGHRDAAEAPRDLNLERAKLAVKLTRLVVEAKALWRSCAAPSCRRAKACRGGPRFPCMAALKPRRLSPEESARTAAELLQAIRAQRRARAAQAFEDNGFEDQGFED